MTARNDRLDRVSGVRSQRLCLIFLIQLWVAASQLCWAQADPDLLRDWPQFLGPQRNGISTETGLIDTWPELGPVELWRVPGGVGMSGLTISRNRLLTLVQTDGEQKLISLDASTGEKQWERALAPEYKNGMGNGPRATPLIAGEMVFAFTGEGILVAVNLTDGKVIWSHNTVKELNGQVAEYGMACSPLVVGKSVCVTVGAPKATVVAYEMTTGKLAWTSGNDPAGYSSPSMLTVGGRRQLVVYTGASVVGLQPDLGTMLWRYPYETNFHCNIATPLAVKDQVFVSSGENHGSVLLGLKPKGEQFEAVEVWKSQGSKSVLRNEWQTSVQLNGFLYGFDNVGAAGPVSHLTCINAETGERAWQQLRFGKGNMIAADGKLFMTTMDGEFVLARANSQSYQEIGRAQVLNSTRQAPSLADGRLFMRDNEEIVCLDVRQK